MESNAMSISWVPSTTQEKMLICDLDIQSPHVLVAFHFWCHFFLCCWRRCRCHFFFTASQLFISSLSLSLAEDCSSSFHRCVHAWTSICGCDTSCTILCIHLLATTFYFPTLYCKHSMILISFRLFHFSRYYSSRMHVCCMYLYYTSSCVIWPALRFVSFTFLFFNLFFAFFSSLFRLASQNNLSPRALALP